MRKLLVLILLLTMRTALGASPEPDKYEHFFGRVEPLLLTKCQACHGPDKQEGGLRLDSFDALKGGDSGPAVVPGDPEKSLLIQAVRHSHRDLSMPPKEKLKPEQIDTLVQWVKGGAVWPSRPLVLFDEEPALVAALDQGSVPLEIAGDDHSSGQTALAIAPGNRFSQNIEGWQVRVRENPAAGEQRYLRLAWKKLGGGSISFELFGARQQPSAVPTRYVAGSNGDPAGEKSLAPSAPGEWTSVTVDLWKDLGDFTLTGIGLAAADGQRALFDALLLGPNVDSLDHYVVGRGQPWREPRSSHESLGDAWSDPANPIVKIWGGKRLDLWSLKKPVRPSLPTAGDPSGALSPIDTFVRSALAERSLAPSAAADRRTLIRRLSFDLVGLPPTPEEVRAFEQDTSSDAYEKLVERLLASPRYGERWARDWLDVVRYAESNGFERDEYRPTAYRYRDYVIRSFNADKPYDEFIREQLAGDELAPERLQTRADADKLIATGFMRLGTFDSAGTIFEEDKKGRDQLMADLVNTTGSAFLGLTLSCCRCHHHKYDPLSQEDHFRLRAFFAGVTYRDDMAIDPADVQDDVAAYNAVFNQLIADLQNVRADFVAKARARVVAKRRSELPADVQELLKIEDSKRDEATRQKLAPVLKRLEVSAAEATAAFDAGERQEYDNKGSELEQVKGRRKTLTTTLGMSDAGSTAPPTQVFFQGDFTEPRHEVPPGFLSALNPNPAKVVPVANGRTTGRRSALAEWIVSPDNPFTARVMVNRIWQHHFGVPLVATPNDFGYSGARPTNQALLDWLATEFVEHGWSVKHMHRLIVMSAAYRQSSADDPARRAVDPENALLWRQNVQRLNAETLRDALLAVSGKLLPVESGPPVWPDLPDEIKMSQPKLMEKSDRLEGWYTSPLEKTFVRSIFLVQKRSVQVPLLEAFDLPESTTSCGRRNVTTVAPQSLMLMNGLFAVNMAEAFAGRLAAASDQPAVQIEQAFQLALGRAADADEQTACQQMLVRHAQIHETAKAPAPARAALVDLCRAILNLNEFIYVD